MSAYYTEHPEGNDRSRWKHVTLSPFNYMNITSADTYVIKQGQGVLKAVNVNTAVPGGIITLYDNIAGSGDTIGTITFPGLSLLQGLIPVDYNILFQAGLTITTVGALDITVIYR